MACKTVNQNSAVFIKGLLLGLFILITGCMPKIQNEDPVGSPELLSHEVVRYSGSQAKVMIYGKCPVATKEFRISAGEESYSVSSASNSLVDGSGIPVAVCNNGNMTITYPVPNPNDSRLIAFKVKVKMNDGRLSVYWAKLNVNYTLPIAVVPGYAVTSGGKDALPVSGDGRLLGSAGEPVGGVIMNNPGLQLRSGLHGILFDDGI